MVANLVQIRSKPHPIALGLSLREWQVDTVTKVDCAHRGACLSAIENLYVETALGSRLARGLDCRSCRAFKLDPQVAEEREHTARSLIGGGLGERCEAMAPRGCFGATKLRTAKLPPSRSVWTRKARKKRAKHCRSA
jgi:hypothetical protein